ncbi:MAG: hypothetical protein AAGL29_06965 [Bacteroidota bacterium]
MKAHSDVVTLKRLVWTLLTLLVVLVLFNFYGPFSNRFYFGKLDGYLFLMLAVFHVLYLFKLLGKAKKEATTDSQLRYMEYVVYGVLVVYGYKTFDTVVSLNLASEIEQELLPKTFFPLVIVSLAFYLLAIILSILTFILRKRILGSFRQETIEDKGIRGSL